MLCASSIVAQTVCAAEPHIHQHASRSLSFPKLLAVMSPSLHLLQRGCRQQKPRGLAALHPSQRTAAAGNGAAAACSGSTQPTFCSLELFALHVLLDSLNRLVYQLPSERTVQHQPAQYSTAQHSMVHVSTAEQRAPRGTPRGPPYAAGDPSQNTSSASSSTISCCAITRGCRSIVTNTAWQHADNNAVALPPGG